MAPLRTSCPSEKPTFRIWPPIIVLMETVEYASTVPIARTWMGMLFRTAEAIVTGTAFGGSFAGVRPPGEQPGRRDATIREQSARRKADRECFRERECSEAPTSIIGIRLLNGDVSASLPGPPDEPPSRTRSCFQAGMIKVMVRRISS